jgi:dipeptidyl aminopeptidase/acylaminoacyl peptidase
LPTKGEWPHLPGLSSVPAALVLMISLTAGLRAQTPNIVTFKKRPITAADGIEMIRLEATDNSAPNSAIAHFSPDGRQFVVVLRHGDLEMNTSNSSLLLYQSTEAFDSPDPTILLKMNSSSNREAIAKVRWLSDNETLMFLGENPGELSQVYSLNVRTKELNKLTNHPTAITNYDVCEDGHKIAFVADPPEQKAPEFEQNSKEIAVTSQDIVEILTSSHYQPQQTFLQNGTETPQRVPLAAGSIPGRTISISPNGRYVVFPAYIKDVPSVWADYKARILKQILGANFRKGTTPLQQYLVFDSKGTTVGPLVDAPLLGPTAISWAKDGNAVFLSSYLPLDVADTFERVERELNKYPIEVKLPEREYEKVRSEDFPTTGISPPEIELTLDQDLNRAPKLYVVDSKNQRKALLLDLNPKLDELDFGTVKTMEWTVDGVELIGGVYLPPDFIPGKRYPLLIQTHGFEPSEFSMDGRSEWGSAFAARQLAAMGVVVLQYAHYKDHAQIDRALIAKSLGVTVGESVLNFHLRAIEAGINLLDNEGLIDRDRVGLSGFSRWVCFAGYILTHSRQRFVAASLVDGISCGYFEEIALPQIAYDFDDLMGGKGPFGEGLKLWMKDAPGFNLDKVETPVQLAAFGGYSVLSAWEWYAGLTLQQKPVDFTYFPSAIHIGVRPLERMSAQQRIVDWFSFWLLGKEDPSPAKREQYRRWRELREQYQAIPPVADHK